MPKVTFKGSFAGHASGDVINVSSEEVKRLKEQAKAHGKEIEVATKKKSKKSKE